MFSQGLLRCQALIQILYMDHDIYHDEAAPLPFPPLQGREPGDYEITEPDPRVRGTAIRIAPLQSLYAHHAPLSLHIPAISTRPGCAKGITQILAILLLLFRDFTRLKWKTLVLVRAKKMCTRRHTHTHVHTHAHAHTCAGTCTHTRARTYVDLELTQFSLRKSVS